MTSANRKAGDGRAVRRPLGMRKPARGRWRTFTLVAAALSPALAFLAAFFFWPVGALAVRGFSNAETFWGVLGAARTWKIAGQTVGMAVAASALSLMLGIPGAYVLYRLRIPGRRLIRSLATAPFALPTVVVGVAFRALLDAGGPLGFLGLGESVAAVVAAMVFFNYSVVLRTVGTMWAEIADATPAARMLGASPVRAFLTVTLPQLGPAIAAAGGLVFLFCSTSFGIVQTLGKPGYGTLESEIYVQTSIYLDLDAAAALSLLQLAIVAIALVVSNALTARTERQLRVARPPLAAVRRSDALPIAVTGFALVFLAAPMLALVVGSLRSGGQWTLRNYAALANPERQQGVTVLEAFDHSIRIGFDAAIIALVIGGLLALMLSRKVRRPWAVAAQRILDGAVLLPLGISAVTVGFGFLITWGAMRGLPPGSVVPLAQAVVALPLVVRALVPTLRAIDSRVREAAQMLGASPLRVLATIDLPIMARGLGGAFGFAFAISLGEFGATAFLASPDYQTLPVLISKLLGRPGPDNYGMALAGSVLLALTTSAAMLLGDLTRPGGRRAGARMPGSGAAARNGAPSGTTRKVQS